MSQSLSSWNDIVGSKFNQAVNDTNRFLDEEIKKVNNQIQAATEEIGKRVSVKSYSKEINELIVG